MTDENSEQNQCFVIAPIGEPESDTRKRSDQVLRHIIRPATTECGYRAIRADEIDKPGLITSQVIQHVVGDPLLIADLTDTNPNVFYELALRHAIRKPLVQLIQKGQRIPFDVSGTRTVHFDHHDLDSVEAAKNEIIEQIRALEAAPEDLETPISISLDLQMWKQSENPRERYLGEIVSAISELRSDLNKTIAQLTPGKGQPVSGEVMELLEFLPRRVAKELSRVSKRGFPTKSVDPFMIRELMHMISHKAGGAIGILVVLGFYRDQFPWLYEIGMEAYRRANAGDWDGAKDDIKDLQMMAEMSVRGPWMEEWVGGDKAAFMMMEEFPFLLERLADEALERGK